MGSERPWSAEDARVERALQGLELYGDDLGADEIVAWFDDEREGYSGLVERTGEPYRYGYHALNDYHGFSRLPARDYDRVLSVGGASGLELLPLASRARELEVLEASAGFAPPAGLPVLRLQASAEGTIPAADNTYDLVTCLGVLHHIANASFVVGEIARVLQPGGFALLREPVVSMGDWRHRRPGLTARERGLPCDILRRRIVEAGFTIVREVRCVFPLTPRLGRLLGIAPFNSPLLVRLDAGLSALGIWPRVYHPRAWWQKIHPSSVFFVLRKGGQRSTEGLR